jgi:uncharacterized protein
MPEPTNPIEPTSAEVRHDAGRAFGFGVPIGALGGLIGLGGAEFRLPVLTGVFRYPPRAAVALNLAISLITVAAALTVRSLTLDAAPVVSLLPVAAAVASGAVVAAYLGVGWVHRVSEVQLRRTILVLLLAIGVGLISEAFVPGESSGLLPDPGVVRLVVAVACGLVIGLISSMLGVAGGEIIIPTLLFVFGADIVAAGTASLLISLPTVLVGVARHARRGAYDVVADRRHTIAPMGVGSIVGAIIGGLLVGLAPQSAIKLLLGVILIVSALRVFRH